MQAQTQAALTPDSVQVGDGATVNYWSDSKSHTVVEVRRAGRQLVLQRDSAQRTNGADDVVTPGGFFAHRESPAGQAWDITPDPDGATLVANWSPKRGRYFVGGPAGMSVSAGRHEHYDYNF